MGLLPALSQVFVAHTIECDNEFEHRMHHRTTRGSAGGAGEGSGGGGGGVGERGPWLVSRAMWANCLRHLAEQELTERELYARARTRTNLAGMKRWGYVKADGELLKLTRAGRRAAAVGAPMAALVETRWRTRYGPETMTRLRAALIEVAARLDAGLPDCVPILGPGLRVAVTLTGHPAGEAASSGGAAGAGSGGQGPRVTGVTGVAGSGEQGPRVTGVTGVAVPGGSARGLAGLSLWELLARVLTGFAVEFERGSRRSLAAGANVVRLLDTSGVRTRDLPLRSGVSKEAIAMTMTVLTKVGAVEITSDGRTRVATPTAKGEALRKRFHQRLDEVEGTFATGSSLDAALEPFADEQRLLEGMRPYPDGWRAGARPPQALPWFPMPLHRGGYPDGA